MFRQMLSRLGLAAAAGIGLLVAGGSATADQQGWPVAGDWSNARSFFGSYSPSYSVPNESLIPQPEGYYGLSRPQFFSNTEGYYGSIGTAEYYGTATAESFRERPARINMRVPSDAKIWFDGNPTNQTGTLRSFESPAVGVGPDYVYTIRVQWNENGEVVTQTRQINIHAGDVINLTLGSPAEARDR